MRFLHMRSFVSGPRDAEFYTIHTRITHIRAPREDVIEMFGQIEMERERREREKEREAL
jgi:hypothetical protein